MRRTRLAFLVGIGLGTGAAWAQLLPQLLGDQASWSDIPKSEINDAMAKADRDLKGVINRAREVWLTRSSMDLKTRIHYVKGMMGPIGKTFRPGAISEAGVRSFAQLILRKVRGGNFTTFDQFLRSLQDTLAGRDPMPVDAESAAFIQVMTARLGTPGPAQPAAAPAYPAPGYPAAPPGYPGPAYPAPSAPGSNAGLPVYPPVGPAAPGPSATMLADITASIQAAMAKQAASGKVVPPEMLNLQIELVQRRLAETAQQRGGSLDRGSIDRIVSETFGVPR